MPSSSAQRTSTRMSGTSGGGSNFEGPSAKQMFSRSGAIKASATFPTVKNRSQYGEGARPTAAYSEFCRAMNSVTSLVFYDPLVLQLNAVHIDVLGPAWTALLQLPSTASSGRRLITVIAGASYFFLLSGPPRSVFKTPPPNSLESISGTHRNRRIPPSQARSISGVKVRRSST